MKILELFQIIANWNTNTQTVPNTKIQKLFPPQVGLSEAAAPLAPRFHKLFSSIFPRSPFLWHQVFPKFPFDNQR